MRGITFRRKDVLDEMLELRRQGWSYPALAERYGVEHSTVRYHCRKNGLGVGIVILVRFHRPLRHPRPKSYLDYLKEVEERHRGKYEGNLARYTINARQHEEMNIPRDGVFLF